PSPYSTVSPASRWILPILIVDPGVTLELFPLEPGFSFFDKSSGALPEILRRGAGSKVFRLGLVSRLLKSEPRVDTPDHIRHRYRTFAENFGHHLPRRF